MTAGRSRREEWRDASACPAISVRAGESKTVNRRERREKKTETSEVR